MLQGTVRFLNQQFIMISNVQLNKAENQQSKRITIVQIDKTESTDYKDHKYRLPKQSSD